MAKDRNYVIHPLYITITLVLASVTSLFIGFSVAYLYNRIQEGAPAIRLPILFYVNTLILVASSFSLTHAKKAYRLDNTERYQLMLGITLALSFLFIIAQLLAWHQLQQANVFIDGGNMGAYLYVISGLHFTHVIAGIPFLAFFLYTAVKKMKEPVSVLVYFSDPDKKRKLDILTIYWHFLDFLWVYLVLFFLINYLIT
jgi:cytochrome c oxidase subunit 3